MLLYFATGFCCRLNGKQRELALVVLGTQNHTLAHNAAHCTWGEVGDETYLLAHKLLGLEVLCYSRENGACAYAVVYLELQQLVGFGYFGALEHCAHANVELEEVVECTLGAYGVCLVVCSLILFLYAVEAVELRLDGVVLYLLEQEASLAKFVTLGKKVGAAQVLPTELVLLNTLGSVTNISEGPASG